MESQSENARKASYVYVAVANDSKLVQNMDHSAVPYVMSRVVGPHRNTMLPEIVNGSTALNAVPGRGVSRIITLPAVCELMEAASLVLGPNLFRLSDLTHIPEGTSPVLETWSDLVLATSAECLVVDAMYTTNLDMVCLILFASTAGVPVHLIVNPDAPEVPPGLMARTFSSVTLDTFQAIRSLTKALMAICSTPKPKDP